jgi:TRAP-type C4-dicarboxylate transport system permease small subunit
MNAPRQIEDRVAVVAMALLCLITLANVVIRYLTDQSIAWTEEISGFLMFLMTMVAASSAFLRERHVRIEYFAESGSSERQRRLAWFSAVTVMLMFLIMGALGVRMAWDEYRFEETSPGIGIPKWWYSVWLPILSFTIAARAALLVRRYRRGFANSSAKP